MWEGSRKPKDSWGVLGEKHPLLSFSFLSDFDFSLIFSQFFFLLSACPLLLQNHQSPCALHVRRWGSFCANVLSAAVWWLWHFTTLALNLGTRGKEGMRCTGESSSHPTKLVLTQPTSGAAGQQDGRDFRNPTEYLGSSFGQLPRTVIQSRGPYTTLASPDHFLLDCCCCPISKVGRWYRINSWAKTWIHTPWFPNCNLKPRIPLSCFCFSPCA